MNVKERLKGIDEKYKQLILENIDSKENYINQIEELHRELGLGLHTGTLIKDELKELNRSIFEKIAIVEFIRSCERSDC